MRTLKKTLALVLVLVTVLGFGASAFAVEFNDADEIKYAEAVAVLSGIGVINGKPAANGTYDFDPAGTLTRAEASKIIAYLLKEETVKANCTFTDAADHWAANYIALCAAKGIVNGVGDNKFDPDGTLTGAAFAKMLLVALGYDADIEGMTGGTWEVGVGSLVKKTGLAAGIVGFDGTAAITREAACQLALNALNANEVYYQSKGTNIEVNGVKMITGATPATAFTPAQKLADEFYLTKTDAATLAGLTDTYGRPLAAQYIQTIPGTAAKTIYEGTKAPLATVVDGSFDLTKAPYKNVWSEGAGCKFFVNAGPNKSEANFDTLAEFQKKPGMAIEFYGTVAANGAVSVTTVVATQYYFATVDVATNKNVTLYIEEPAQMIGGGPAFDVVIPYDANALTQSLNYQKVAGLAKGDVVMVLMKAGPDFNDVDYDDRCTVLDVYKATPVTGSTVTATKYTGAYNGSMKIDGVEYTFANCYSQNAAAALGAITGTFYTDANGYLMGYVGAAPVAQSNFVYVQNIVATVKNTDLLGTPTVNSAKAEVIFVDGTHKVVELALTSNGAGGYTYTKPASNGTVGATTTLAALAKTGINNWFAYTEIDGAYKLTAIDSNYAAVAGADVSLTLNTAATIGGKYTTSATKVVSIATGTYVATAKTGLVAATLDYDAVANAVLYTYVPNTTTVAAIYAVGQGAIGPVAGNDYAYAVAQGDTTVNGTEWTFYVNGETKTYTIRADQSVTAKYAYKLTKVTGKDVYTVSNATDVRSSAATQVTVADTTYFVAGSAYYYATNPAAVIYNVTTGHAGEADVVEARDYVVVIGSGSTASVVYIVDAPSA